MLCRCGKKAVYHRKYEGTYLCKEHFIRSIESRAKHEIRRYKIKSGERLAVAISGGKDSSALLYLVNKVFGKRRDIEIIAITIDEGIAGYRDESVGIAKRLCKKLGIEHHIFSFKDEFGLTLDEKLKGCGEAGACTYCGVGRRWLLNRKARELGAKRLFIGHNLDDEAQSIMMDYMKGDILRLARMEDYIVKSSLFIQRIKPFRNIPEREIGLYAMLVGLEIQQDECPHLAGMRFKIRDFLNELELESPGIKFSVVRTGRRIANIINKNSDFEGKGIKKCRICGEHSTSDICKTCELWRA